MRFSYNPSEVTALRKQPGASLRDTENVPLTENIQDYFEREVLPFAPDAWIDEKIRNQSICYEYGRFQHRVIRMMESLAETGQTDFSSCFHSPREYVVSVQSGKLIEKALDYH